MPYVIDGNNLLGSWGGPAVRGDGRVEVLRRVAAFCRARGARATIVFDGAPFRAELGGQEMGRVSVRFPPTASDADSVIREMIDAAARPSELTVVSSDKAVYSYARTRGARALRAREWSALARGAAHHPRRTPREGSEKPERETDIEGWLERFSRR
ncbi:MAG: NYN domain-containing protein [Acidobacteria bacterium]|nr:NYN domain-containing protein [Acidobacteriota bacterium]